MQLYIVIYLYRNEIIASTWLEDPKKRPTFAEIGEDLTNIYSFTETTETNEQSIRETDDTAESNGYISIIPM